MEPAAAPRPASQRERIVLAAMGLFATRGFDDVTMADVAREAGAARATVFNHFGSKRALVEAITADVFAHYQRMLDAALADERHSTATLVRALFEQMGAGIEPYKGFHRGVFREIAKLHVGLDEGGAGQRAREAALERIVRLFERGQARGELTRAQPAEDLALAYDALANGTITHWLYDDAEEPLRERMRRAAEIFLGPVASPEAAVPHPLPELVPPPRLPQRMRPERAPSDLRREPRGGSHDRASPSSRKARRRPRARSRRA
jgi:AcrR family transcriptional regulator